jgi:thiol-disulfide isomerase/thioredoxin
MRFFRRIFHFSMMALPLCSLGQTKIFVSVIGAPNQYIYLKNGSKKLDSVAIVEGHQRLKFTPFITNKMTGEKLQIKLEKSTFLDLIVKNGDSISIEIDYNKCKTLGLMSKNAIIHNSPWSVEENAHQVRANEFGKLRTDIQQKIAKLLTIDSLTLKTILLKKEYDSLITQEFNYLNHKILSTDCALCAKTYAISAQVTYEMSKPYFINTANYLGLIKQSINLKYPSLMYIFERNTHLSNSNTSVISKAPFKLGERLPKVRVYNERYDAPINMNTDSSKYALIEFWASWCKPCIASVPLLKKIREKYQPNLKIISISLDKKEDIDKWLDTIEKYQLHQWKHYLLFENGIITHDLHHIPYNIIIDPKGNVVNLDVHGDQLEAFLSDLFKK